MPVQYSSILDEHHAVRSHAGIFDISHMGQILVSGPNAANWLNQLLTNNVDRLAPGQGQYSLLLNEQAGVIDDLIVYRTGPSDFFIVVNASKTEEDFFWLASHQDEDIILRNESHLWAGIAVQGPHAAAIFATAFPNATLPPRNGYATTPNGAIVCRTGYTGEDGFEWFCPTHDAIPSWNAFTHAGATPCGLGARDTLRLEMCYPLNGNDLSPIHSPIEAGLGFFVDLTKPHFTGRDTLLRQKTEGPTHKLAAIQCATKGPPIRAHYPVLAADTSPIGELSSGALSPSLMTGIGLAYLPAAHSAIGTQLLIDVRGRHCPATVVKKPFYKKS